jgi:HSP20 family molecular chaperone IbpA
MGPAWALWDVVASARLPGLKPKQIQVRADTEGLFFEAEEAPAHDHRARHNFKRARASIIEVAYRTTMDVNL